jgi:hypothetical protein
MFFRAPTHSYHVIKFNILIGRQCPVNVPGKFMMDYLHTNYQFLGTLLDLEL